MFVLTQDTLLNPAILETRSLPRRFLGRVMPFPRRGASRGFVARLIFEMQLLRYFVSLVPFVIAMLIWPRFAAPLAQAPLAMVVMIAFVEVKLLRYSERKRAGLMSDAEADRVLDLLRFRARDILARLAARRDLAQGSLHLVIEQSDMARVPPLTLVSVQGAQPTPHVLALDAGDRALLGALFDADLSERDLLRVNQRSQTFLRDIAFEARGVTAHARLAAALDRKGLGLAAPEEAPA